MTELTNLAKGWYMAFTFSPLVAAFTNIDRCSSNRERASNISASSRTSWSGNMVSMNSAGGTPRRDRGSIPDKDSPVVMLNKEGRGSEDASRFMIP